MAENPYPYDTTLVSELLKHKRRSRSIRSCFPCRHRKIRCDGQVPCSSCVKRNHAELCRVPISSRTGRQEESSEIERLQPGNDVRVEAPFTFSNPNVLISRLEKIEEQITSLKADLRATTSAATATAASSPVIDPESAGRQSIGHGSHSNLHSGSAGRHVVEDATGATIFLGGHSDTPLALGCREALGSGDLMLQNAMADQFVPRAYPFTNLWGPDATVKEVCASLPDDSDIIRYWQAYQSTAYPFYPVLAEIDTFGEYLFAFLNQRASAQENSERISTPDPSWLALLFAVLACGIHFSEDHIKERDLRSKVFICSSFHCLRISDFFNHTDLDQIQAMALIGHCLRNNLDTNSAWILMGATIRLAQSIGLHESSPSMSPGEQLQRSRLWWTLIWQDTFLSFTYDRPPSSSLTRNSPMPYASTYSGLSFQECIFKLCRIILEQTTPDTSRTETTRAVNALNYKRQLEGIWDTAAQHLTSKLRCKSLQDHLERLALGIHLGYAICRVVQVCLHAGTADDEANTMIAGCKHQAMKVIECFLELHRFSARVCRSWAFVHNAVSCGITLNNLSHVPLDGSQDSGALVQRLITVLEKEAAESEWRDTDLNVRHFGPYSRPLKAMKEIYSGHYRS
ncbi:fungal-specific transcription factor domain-containing protein [Aspergillus pseudoustus]|uniref:Fungal-specific transcription factor domain-containing protein n=1 Tax=Aspergillus pseudoustus TaxID=1810923 RepID=A0ABR4K333_9EURO